MKVLVCCEESQRVCISFRKRGWEAYSCDIQEESGGYPEWHIQGDVLPYVNGDCQFTTRDGVVHHIQGKWDLLICHPPCTYLSNAGSRHLYKGGKLNDERFHKGLKAKEFFMTLLNANCKHIAVENPVPSKIYGLPHYTQIIQPCYFGEPYQKRTCLWLADLPLLLPTDIVKGEPTSVTGNWFNCAGADRAKRRSKTFWGIANAMADQWGRYLENL